MIKTEATRQREVQDSLNGWRKVIETLWIPESLDETTEWRAEDESAGPNFSNFMPLQGFPAR